MSAKGRARLSAFDMLAMLWRERRTAALAALMSLALGAALMFTTPDRFVARTQLLVGMDQSYLVQARTGEILNAELRLIGSPEVARRTIARIGLKRLYPGLTQAAAETAFTRDLTAAPAPDAPILLLTFAHKDRQIAALTLDALTAEYLAHRRRLFAGQPPATRPEASTAQLQALLAEAGVADFDGALRSASDLLARLDQDAATAVADRRSLEARADALRQRLRSQPAQIELFAETDADKRAGPIRRGPNPVRQALETELYETEAGVRAQTARAAAIEAQKVDLAARVRKLQEIEPRYRALVADLAVSRGSAATLPTTDGIRQIEPAHASPAGRARRFDIALLAVVLAIVASIIIALVRGFGRVSFPTPSSAARTLDAPVLGVALQRRPA